MFGARHNSFPFLESGQKIWDIPKRNKGLKLWDGGSTYLSSTNYIFERFLLEGEFSFSLKFTSRYHQLKDIFFFFCFYVMHSPYPVPLQLGSFFWLIILKWDTLEPRFKLLWPTIMAFCCLSCMTRHYFDFLIDVHCVA